MIWRPFIWRIPEKKLARSQAKIVGINRERAGP
jgi:hypothetical protein